MGVVFNYCIVIVYLTFILVRIF